MGNYRYFSMAEVQNAMEKWKEMRLMLLRGLAVPRKLFPHQPLVQAEPPQQV